MTETPETAGSQDDLSTQKEVWITAKTDWIRETFDIDKETAAGLAHWAFSWIDEYKRVCAEEGSIADIAALRQRLVLTCRTAFESSPGAPKYPHGVPTLQSMMVTHEIFCSTFTEEEQLMVRDILRTMLYN